jgi:ATP-dependent RNA helicase RhlE
MPKEISGLAGQILRNPETIQIDFEKPLNTVAHALYPVAQHLKGKFLQVLLKELHMNSALIFTRTKARAKRLGLQLTKAGYAATSLQGNMSQSQRSRSLDGFRSGKYQILVATDIAARGIDISDISHVINFDIPDTVEAYVHRIGRTGRAAKNGDAFTLVTDDDKQLVGRIEKKIGMRIEKRTIEEFDYTAAPIKNGPQQGRRPAVRHKRADKPLETAGKVVDGIKKTRQAGNAKAKINAKSKAKRNRRYASR